MYITKLSAGRWVFVLLSVAFTAVLPQSALAEQVANQRMLVNAKTGKCLTIAGGRSTANNVEAVQFNCDSDRSRRWTLKQMAGDDIYQIQNVQTGKCLTIAGGESTANNVTALQFDCDSDRSRRWMLKKMAGDNVYQIKNLKTGKCLTIAGGESTANNVTALQFDCDSDRSRRWSIRLTQVSPQIRPPGPQPRISGLEGRFVRPMYKNGPARLDVCQHLGKYCGQAAANDYCYLMGYERATKFEIEPASPTRVINFGQECRGSVCRGFKFIDCITTAKERGKVRSWPAPMDPG